MIELQPRSGENELQRSAMSVVDASIVPSKYNRREREKYITACESLGDVFSELIDNISGATYAGMSRRGEPGRFMKTTVLVLNYSEKDENGESVVKDLGVKYYPAGLLSSDAFRLWAHVNVSPQFRKKRKSMEYTVSEVMNQMYQPASTEKVYHPVVCFDTQNRDQVFGLLALGMLPRPTSE